jgi:hypothetical protein
VNISASVFVPYAKLCTKPPITLLISSTAVGIASARAARIKSMRRLRVKKGTSTSRYALLKAVGRDMTLKRLKLRKILQLGKLWMKLKRRAKTH